MIIDDQSEFIRRIHKASEALGFKYLCGNVSYRKPKKNGAPLEINQPHVMTKTDPAIDFSSYIPDGAKVYAHDAFMKMDIYKNQNEWRIALYRGVKDTRAYQLDIGDIRDIAHWVKKGELTSEIDRLLNKGIRPFCKGFYGNIDRREMKEKFYRLGDNKAHIISIIG